MTEQTPNLEIRLQRMANRKRPCFRLVVTPAGDRSGRFLEQLGTYDPMKAADEPQLNLTRLREWLDLGATPVGDAIKAVAHALPGQ